MASAPPFSALSIASDQCSIESRSTGGTPNMSQITISGNGAARSWRRSHSSRSTNCVDELVAGGSYPPLDGAHPRRRERAAHEPSPLPVARRVHVDHPRERPGSGVAPTHAREDGGVRLGVARAVDLELGIEQIDPRRSHRHGVDRTVGRSGVAHAQGRRRISPLFSELTRQCSTSAIWFTAVPRTWRTPSWMLLIPWM